MRKAAFYTLGCKVSQYETEAIAEAFRDRGYEICDFSDVCDVYVINTCTVTAEADRKSRQVIRRAKKINPCAKVLVCGCYSQRSPDEVEAIPDVDAVIGSAGKMELVDIAERLLLGGEREIRVTDLGKEPFEPMRITEGPRTRVYVKIEDGCGSRCTYCAIRSARGPVRSKPREAVIEEVEALAKSGVAEIVLTGIETGSYGEDFSFDYRLADLIAELDERKSAELIRLGSLAPEQIGEDFVRKTRGRSILAPHFHLSIQSGSDKILRSMKRRYSRKMALDNIKRIREAYPRVTFTTDIMVGFPGETEEDFLDSLSFAEEARFLDAHVFTYSKRKDTPAATYPDQVPECEKKKRSEILIKRVAEIRREVLAEMVLSGEALPTVFETNSDGVWIGHSDNYAEIKVECQKDIHGARLSVRPLRVEGDSIIGEIIDFC